MSGADPHDATAADHEASILTRALLISLASVCLCTTALSAGQGKFTGTVAVELMDEIEFDHKLKLLQDFGFRDAGGKVWLARKGGILDGASLPRELRDLTGLPFVVEYRKASVVHDYYCRVKTEPWRDVHRMFYDASLVEGISEPEAKTLYLAVYAGGWRWEIPGTSCYRSCHASAASLAWKPVVTESIIQPMVEWIKQANPTLDEIEKRVDAVTRRPGPHLFAQLP
jgi:hypothetical protein